MNKLFVIIFLFLLFNYIQNVPNEDEEEIDLSIDEDDTKPTPPPKQVQPQQPTQQQQVKEPTPAPSYQPPVANQTDKSAVVTKQMNV